MRRVRLAVSTGLGLILILLIIMPVKAGDKSEESYADQLVQAARSYLGGESRDRDRAMELCRQILREQPDHPESLEIAFRMAGLLTGIYDPKKGECPRIDEAVGIYQWILENSPETQLVHVQSQMCLANCYRMKGLFDKAQKEYGKVLSIDESKIELPQNFKRSEATAQDKLAEVREGVKRVKQRTRIKMIDLTTKRRGTQVEKVMRIYKLIERYPEEELTKLAQEKINKLGRVDPRNVDEIAGIERQVLAEVAKQEVVSSLDERYLVEIDRLEREVVPPLRSGKPVRKEIMITTEEALAAMEQEVMEDSERAIEGKVKK